MLGSWARHHLILTVPLSTQDFKWVPATKCCGVYLRWTSIPSRGCSNTPSRLHATETGISSGSVGQFGPERLYLNLYYFDMVNSLLSTYHWMFCFLQGPNWEFRTELPNWAIIEEEDEATSPSITGQISSVED